MIAAITGLLVCQCCGEILVRALSLPLPGPVAGLGLLFGYLVIRGRRRPELAETVPDDLGRVCDALLKNLSLLFIPAAVGVVQYLALLRTYALPIAIALMGSTTLALVGTALIFRLASRLQSSRRPPQIAGLEGAGDLQRPR
jgi:holin-like protein